MKTELAVEREARRTETQRADVAEAEARTARAEVAELGARVGAIEDERQDARAEIARLRKETA